MTEAKTNPHLTWLTKVTWAFVLNIWITFSHCGSTSLWYKWCTQTIFLTLISRIQGPDEPSFQCYWWEILCFLWMELMTLTNYWIIVIGMFKVRYKRCEHQSQIVIELSEWVMNSKSEMPLVWFLHNHTLSLRIYYTLLIYW